jgi:uncharacterized protein YvpB
VTGPQTQWSAGEQVQHGQHWSTWSALVNIGHHGQHWSTLVNMVSIGQHWSTWSALVNIGHLGQHWSTLVNMVSIGQHGLHCSKAAACIMELG